MCRPWEEREGGERNRTGRLVIRMRDRKGKGTGRGDRLSSLCCEHWRRGLLSLQVPVCRMHQDETKWLCRAEPIWGPSNEGERLASRARRSPCPRKISSYRLSVMIESLASWRGRSLLGALRPGGVIARASTLPASKGMLTPLATRISG